MKKIIIFLISILLFTGCAQTPTADEIAQKAVEIIEAQPTAAPTPTAEPVDTSAIAKEAASILNSPFKVGDKVDYNGGKTFTFPLSGISGATEYATITEYYFKITEVNILENGNFEKRTDGNGNPTYYFYDNKAQKVMKGTVDKKHAGKTLLCWNFNNSAIVQSDGSFIFIADMQNVQKDFVLNSPIAIFLS